MRTLFLIPLLAAATPAVAQYAPPFPQTNAPPPYGAPSAIPPQMLDPALPAQLGRMAGALTHSFMNLPVGELQAAIEGRPVTPADRRHTVGSEVGPYASRDIQRDVASSAGAMQNSARAMQRAMPAVQQALAQAVAAIAQATANLPSPAYPRR